MGIPNVSVKKSQTGSSPALQSAAGILAIIASANTGPTNQPGTFTNLTLLTSTYGPTGILPEYTAYNLDVTGLPTVCLRGTTSVAGSYGAIGFTSTGGSATPVAGGTAPLDHYNFLITFTSAVVLGTTGATYTYSTDNGVSTSGPQNLGTALSITIPNTGASFTLGTSTQTYNKGDVFTCNTERPLLGNTDVTTSLTALNMTRLPWEGVLIDAQYNTGLVGLVDTWLGAREQKGQFNFAVLNTRYLLEPLPNTESAATYAAAITTQTQNDSSNRLCVGADGGHNVSVLTGWNIKRPTSLALASMAMSLTPNIGVAPSFVGNGPVEGFQISSGSNPYDWDEDIYASLDSQRLTTLRSFAPGGPQGVYITNPNVLAPSGSTIIWLQLLRVLNKACSICWQILNTQLNKGIRSTVNSQGMLVIDERDAQVIEQLVNDPLQAGLAGQVTGALFSLNRDDNLATPGTSINATVQIQPLIYATGFNVTVGLVKTITVPTAS